MRYYYIIILILTISTQYSAAEKINFDPIEIHFYGLIKNDSTTIAFGTSAAALISDDNDRTWRHTKIFKYGRMINMFWNENSITAFNNRGEIAVSNDRGSTWQLMSSLQDSVLSVIEVNNGYLIRTTTYLKKISNKYRIINSYPLESDFDNHNYKEYRLSLAYFKNSLIAEIDNSRHIVYDIDLNIVDTIDYKSMGYGSNSREYRIYSNEDHFYAKFGNTILRSKDLENFETVYECEPTFIMYSMSDDGNVYVLDSTRYRLNKSWRYNDSCKYILRGLTDGSITKYKYTDAKDNLNIDNIVVKHNEIYMVGVRNHISKYVYSDSDIQIISHRGSTGMSIVKADSDTLLFYGGDRGSEFNPSIVYSTDSGVTFHSYVEKEAKREFAQYGVLDFIFYNKELNKLYIAGRDGRRNLWTRMISKNRGKTFIYLNIGNFLNLSIFRPFSNVCKNAGGFVAASHKVPYIDYVQGSFIFYDDNYEEYCIKYYVYNSIIHYVFAPDTNNILTYSYDNFDSTYSIRYKEEGDSGWNYLKKYNNNISMVKLRELDYKGRKYLAIFNYYKKDTTCYLEVLDVETREIRVIDQHKLQSPPPYLIVGPVTFSDIYCEKDTIYYAAWDTLYCITELFDRSTWKVNVFPNNGHISRRIGKIGDRLYSRYSDDKLFSNNCWITLSPDDPDNGIRITAEDNTFEPTHIEDEESETISITNPSQTSDLLITARSQLHGHAFTTDLPLMTPDNPLIIPAGESYDYKLNFKPSEVKEYRDSIIFYSNAMGTDSVARFSGSGIDTSTGINEIESGAYLYAYPPYPMPAKGLVRSLIYFDNEIASEDVEIFDRFGVKVGGAEDISIDKVKSYSAILTWNCSGVATGVYFIRVRNGNRMKVLKVIVKK